MSESPPVFCLPLLHPALERAALSCPPVRAVHLWPGLPQMPAGYWAATNYPFDGATAQSCVQQMESLSEAALSGVPMQTLASMERAPEIQKKRKELQDIDTFTSNGLPPTSAIDSTEVVRAAQKALLWAWLLEEKVLEVNTIMGSYTDNASHLLDALGGDEDDHDTGLSMLASLDRDLDNSAPVLPPWAMVLENAAIFLPDTAIIAVNSEDMAADLRDRLTFAPASAQTRALWEAGTPVGTAAPACAKNCELEEASVPLWQALGKSAQCDDQPWRMKTYTFVLCGVRA